MRRPLLFALFGLLLASRVASSAQAKAVCQPDVSPIRNQTIKVDYTVRFNYTPTDAAGARVDVTRLLHETLNYKGRADANRFVYADGAEPNFYVNLILYDDGTDHFTVTATLSGWGQGRISEFENKNPFSSAKELVANVAEFVHGFVHDGWHDDRPECAAARRASSAARRGSLLSGPVLSTEGLQRMRARAMQEPKNATLSPGLIQLFGLGNARTAIEAKQIKVERGSVTHLAAVVLKPNADDIIFSVKERSLTRVFLTDSSRVLRAALEIDASGKERRLTVDQAGPQYQVPLRTWGDLFNPR